MFTVKYSMVAGIWMSTMLPLPRDLELLIDSMYDDGYSAEYLVKSDDITGDDLAQSDLLLGWERPLGQSSAENPVMGIVDPDRDGARSLPAWMNYSKAVFVPNEIDYKVRARHRFHPHNGRMGGSIQKQVELYQPDENINSNREAKHSAQMATATKPKSTNTSENLDFLLPIPNYGSTTPNFQYIKTTKNKKIRPSKKKSQSLKSSFLSNFIMPQIPEIPVMTPVTDFILTESMQGKPSLLALVDRFRKQLKRTKNENFTKNDETNEVRTLEKLHEKLLQIKNRNEMYYQAKKSEEEKQLSQMEDSNAVASQIIKHRAIRPLITHTRVSHPGHRETYVAHVKPLTLHQRINKYIRKS